MNTNFDKEQAKKNLQSQELVKTEDDEKIRKTILNKVLKSLKELFKNSQVEVFLVGSITQPYKFHSLSDVDVVLKNFEGDRFDIWTQLEGMIERNVEIIIFEKCHFQDHVIKEGLKVI